MNRTNFYKKFVLDSVEELDFLWNSLSSFEIRYDPQYYRVTGVDVMRPDLISYRCYGVVDFWWVVLLVNEITNPFTDIVEGMVLKIPSKLDIYDFQRKYRLCTSK